MDPLDGLRAALREILPARMVAVVDGERDGGLASAGGTASGTRSAVEFRMGRSAVRAALSLLGLSAQTLPRRASGALAWPPGVTGSISHRQGVYVAITSRTRDFAALGVDLERETSGNAAHVRLICSTSESAWLARRGHQDQNRWAGIFFSAKESVLKCLAPEPGGQPDWPEVEIFMDDATGQFRARLTTARTAPDLDIGIEGRFTLHSGWILCAAWIPAVSATRPAAT